MKRIYMIGGFIAMFVLGALSFAFAQNTFFSQAATATEGSGERVMEIAVEEVINGETHSGVVQVKNEEADGLPDISADVDGVFLSYDADTVMIGTGNIEIEVEVEQVNDQEPVMAVSAAHSGPDVAVRVTDATIVYEDTTPDPQPTFDEIDAGEMTLKRTIALGDLANLADNMLIRAWGTMDGETLVAEILVYEEIR